MNLTLTTRQMKTLSNLLDGEIATHEFLPDMARYVQKLREIRTKVDLPLKGESKK